MSNLIAGVDPGFEGAVATLRTSDGLLDAVWDMPLRPKRPGLKREVDIDVLNAIFVEIHGRGVSEVKLEWPTTRPEESAEASKRFGVGLGNVEALVVANGMKLDRVAPNHWKQSLGLTGKKNTRTTPLEARKLACDECLRLVTNVSRKTLYGPRGGAKDGRAEAILIAFWSWSRAASAHRVLAGRWGKGSTEAQAFMLSAGRRGRKVKKGPLF